MENEIKARWWWNLPIVLLILVLVPLGARSLITDDNRYGWGTFSKQVAYRINYYWVMENGEIEIYKPGKELSGKVRKKLKRSGNTRYSLGALESWMTNYTRFIFNNKRPNQKVKSFRAVVDYKINSKMFRRSDGNIKRLLVEYPEKPGE